MHLRFATHEDAGPLPVSAPNSRATRGTGALLRFTFPMNTDDVPQPDPTDAFDPSTPETCAVQTPPPPPPPTDWGYWIRRLLVCNPFFLCSAALLLFAINRLYNDSNFLHNDGTQKLLFNFSALQIYELLLIATAMILAGRKIWYDSALLVVLENGLALLPFMLLSQAALIDARLAWALTITGGLAAFARFGALRRWYPHFNLPPRALALGALLLVLNAALPKVFRAVIAVDYYNWHIPNLIGWYALLPVLAAGANLLPRVTRYGGINPERHWLPLFLYALWLSGTAVHVWSVGHIAARPFEFPFLAPVVWVSAWTFWNRLRDFTPAPSVGLQKLALVLPILAPLLAAENATVFTILCTLNVFAFLVIALTRRVTLARELALASLLLAFAGMPLEWTLLRMPAFQRTEHVAAAMIIYCIIYALRSPKPEAALLGAFALGIGIAWLGRQWTPAVGLQAAFVFFLVHSLRWQDEPMRPDRAIRNLIAFFWILHAAIWTRNGWPESAFAAAGAVLTISAWTFYLWRKRRRGPISVPVASALTAFSGPANWFTDNSSPGLLALAGSFLLFAIGTVLALTRNKWDSRSTSSV
jgi:hypothetical protein